MFFWGRTSPKFPVILITTVPQIRLGHAKNNHHVYGDVTQNFIKNAFLKIE